jgi:hypothetical protein
MAHEDYISIGVHKASVIDSYILLGIHRSNPKILGFKNRIRIALLLATLAPKQALAKLTQLFTASVSPTLAFLDLDSNALTAVKTFH